MENYPRKHLSKDELLEITGGILQGPSVVIQRGVQSSVQLLGKPLVTGRRDFVVVLLGNGLGDIGRSIK